VRIHACGLGNREGAVLGSHFNVQKRVWRTIAQDLFFKWRLSFGKSECRAESEKVDARIPLGVDWDWKHELYDYEPHNAACSTELA
jgi:hypothetical protein